MKKMNKGVTVVLCVLCLLVFTKFGFADELITVKKYQGLELIVNEDSIQFNDKEHLIGFEMASKCLTVEKSKFFDNLYQVKNTSIVIEKVIIDTKNKVGIVMSIIVLNTNGDVTTSLQPKSANECPSFTLNDAPDVRFIYDYIKKNYK